MMDKTKNYGEDTISLTLSWRKILSAKECIRSLDAERQKKKWILSATLTTNISLKIPGLCRFGLFRILIFSTFVILLRITFVVICYGSNWKLIQDPV